METHNDFYKPFAPELLVIEKAKSSYGNWKIHTSIAQTKFFMRKQQAVNWLTKVRNGEIVVKPAFALND